jgi:hypothetical protein
MAERRYSEDEVAAILKIAAERQQLDAGTMSSDADAASAPGAGGMTLTQLQEIAREVGIPGDMILHAAHSLDRMGRPVVRRLFGMPIGVGRTVALGRRLSESEWERLVVDLRQTFDAQGRLRDDGSFKQWSNGNLKAILEPADVGQQLRLRTLNGQATIYVNGGIALLAMSGIFEIVKLFGLVPDGPPAMLAVFGAALLALGALRLPRWARTRQEQMEAIATRLVDKLPAPGSGQDVTPVT